MAVLHGGPLSTDAGETDKAQLTQAAGLEVAKGGTAGSARVLVVDDDPDTCQLLTTLLEGRKFDVDVAINGFEGLEKLDGGRPDLVVLDVMMPGIDGFETYRRLRKITDTPVLFLSAKNDVKSVARALEIGAADYMDKPFTNGDFVSRVANLLNAHATQLASDDNHSDLRLDEIVNPEAPALPAFANNKFRVPSRGYKFLKGFIDLAGGMIGSILVALIFLPVAALIRRESDGPILFKHVRIGKNGEPFRILKFRTMKGSTPAYIQKGTESVDGFVTPLGQVLRRTLIDELPQFLNVLRGEMSLVGPRPELPNIVGRYSSWERERLTVKPGITGWWQINGMRQPMSAYTHLDVEYVRHRSIRLDVHIIWITVQIAIKSVLFKESRESSLPGEGNSLDPVEPSGVIKTKQNGPNQELETRASYAASHFPGARELSQDD